MSCNNEIHLNDIGTEFIVTIVECINEVDVPIDISTATLKQIFFLKPDGIVLTKTASFTSISSGGTGDGSDGMLSYFSVVGDLDLLNSYKLQGKVYTPLGNWGSSTAKFKVVKNLY